MFVVTHALSPVVLAGLVDVVVLESTWNRWMRRRQYVGIAVAGALPDLLWPHLSLEARYSSPTHTVWFLVVVFVVAAVWGGRFVDRERPWLLTWLMAGACGWHLFCDTISGGIKWGYPFFDDVVERNWLPYPIWVHLDAISLSLVMALVWWLMRREKALRG